MIERIILYTTILYRRLKRFVLRIKNHDVSVTEDWLLTNHVIIDRLKHHLIGKYLSRLMRNFTNFFQKRNRERLYRQWMEHEGISLEDVPPDVLQDIRRKELNSLQEGTELSGEDMYEENMSHMRTQNLSIPI